MENSKLVLISDSYNKKINVFANVDKSRKKLYLLLIKSNGYNEKYKMKIIYRKSKCEISIYKKIVLYIKTDYIKANNNNNINSILKVVVENFFVNNQWKIDLNIPIEVYEKEGKLLVKNSPHNQRMITDPSLEKICFKCKYRKECVRKNKVNDRCDDFIGGAAINDYSIWG